MGQLEVWRMIVPSGNVGVSSGSTVSPTTMETEVEREGAKRSIALLREEVGVGSYLGG